MDTRRLFGGTLVAAGLLNAAAVAQEFQLAYTFAQVNANDYAGDMDSDLFFGPGEWSLSVSVGSGAVSTSTGSPTVIDATGFSTEFDTAYTVAFVEFYVTADTQVVASWDFTGDDLGRSNDFYVTDIAGNIVMFIARGSPPDSMAVSLFAGQRYSMQGIVFATSGIDGESFVRLAVGGDECPADFNGDGEVNTLDVLAFLNAWSSGDAEADFNGDGDVNTIDVLAFLNAWTAGC